MNPDPNQPGLTLEADATCGAYRIVVRESESRQGLHVTVTDTVSRAQLEVARRDLLPLLKAIRRAARTVSLAAAGAPMDPVVHAIRAIPVSGKWSVFEKIAIKERYERDLAALRARHLEFVDASAQKHAAMKEQLPGPKS